MIRKRRKHHAHPVPKSQTREWIESIVIALVLALLIREFVVQAFKIPSGSMIPTFQIGDRIFVNKFLYGARIPFTDIRLPKVREPRTGDIIVFKSTEDKKKDFVKRLIGVENDTVEIKEGKVYVNGKAFDTYVEDELKVRSGRVFVNGDLQPEYKNEEILGRANHMRPVYYLNVPDYGAEGVPIRVPKDSYYVLGDNSGNSRDSRYWGFVPKRNVIGKAILIYWPLNRVKIIK